MINFGQILNEGVTISSSGTTGPAKDIFRDPQNLKEANKVAVEAQKISTTSKILTVTKNPDVITCEIASNTVRPNNNSFILFTKDNKANISGILGYYAEVEMRNNSKAKSELFSVGTEIFESSK